MNELMYEISEWCKDITVKNFKEYARLWLEDFYRLVRRNKFSNKQTVQNLIDRLDNKIRVLVKFKLRAEKLLDEYK